MKLLIVSPDAYSVFHTETSYIFGGIEIETGHHARGLAGLGVEVAVATRDQGVPSHKHNGVWIHPIHELKGKGYWATRQTLGGRIRYRLFGDRNPYKTLEELFRAVDPDAGYIMGMSPEALRLARYCKANGKAFIFRVAHDKDLGDDPFTDTTMQRWAKVSVNEAKEVISTASVVLAQTPVQETLLRERFARESELVFPPIDLSNAAVNPQRKYDVMWVGRSNSFKRPELMIEAARRLPAVKFCMVFNKADEADWNAKVSTLPSNVELIESVPADAIEKLFAASRLFLSTSLYEGFPNTFLQAAKNGTPVISMGSNPNEMLSAHGAGILAGDDIEQVVQSVQLLLNDAEQWNAYSDKAKQYVARFNDVKMINQFYFDLLKRVTIQQRREE